MITVWFCTTARELSAKYDDECQAEADHFIALHNAGYIVNEIVGNELIIMHLQLAVIQNRLSSEHLKVFRDGSTPLFDVMCKLELIDWGWYQDEKYGTCIAP